jgi:heme exporter protein B
MNVNQAIIRTKAVLMKDLRSEFRTRYAISAIMLFILTSVSMIVFSLAHEKISPGISSGILWIIMFFGAMTGLSKSFVSEEERGTGFLLSLYGESFAVFFGKLAFNILLSLVLNLFAAVLFLLLINQEPIRLPVYFFLTIIFGSIGMASASTIISALIAKANTKNALFPVLSFPLLIPLIITGIESTTISIENVRVGALDGNFRLMFAYSGVVIVASYLLFDYIWKE